MTEKVSLARLLYERFMGAGEVAQKASDVARAVGREIGKARISYNPLHAAHGSILFIRLPEYRDNRFVIDAINVTKRTINGRELHFADYHLVDRNDTTDGDDGLWRMLRVIPNSGKKDVEHDVHEFYLFTKRIDTGFDEFVFDALNHGELPLDDLKDRAFARPEGSPQSYAATVTEYTAEGDETSSITYWDFIGYTEQEGFSFFVIEMSESDHWFEGYLGVNIDPKMVEII